MRFLFCLLLLFSVVFCEESEDSNAKRLVLFLKNQMQDSYENGRLTALLPINTWHNRYTYSEDRVQRYNERPYGLGISKTINKKYELYGIYGIVFADSNYHTQSMFGYIHLYHLNKGSIKFALGYTVGLTQRYEYWYIPLPLPLPAMGINYKSFSIQAAYVPGGKNDANVLFSWLSWIF